MRFRLVSNTQTVIWGVITLLEITQTSAELHHDLVRHRTGSAHFHLVMLVCWALIGLFFLYTNLFSRLEFEPTALRLRIGFRSIFVRYDNIVSACAVRTSKGRLLPHQVELETARLSRDIYPHDYRRLAVGDPGVFVHALRDKAPQIETDLA